MVGDLRRRGEVTLQAVLSRSVLLPESGMQLRCSSSLGSFMGCSDFFHDDSF